MPEPVNYLVDRLRNHFGPRALALSIAHDEATLEVAPSDWLGAARELRDRFGFEVAVDLCGVDYLSYGQDEWETTEATSAGFSRGVEGEGAGRFAWADRPRGNDAGKSRYAVALHVLSIRHNQRLRVRCRCNDEAVPVVSSLVSVWPGLNWFEREAFDLFGIVFDGHPDLRRLLTDYGFVGHPFRKDFPLIGNVEVRYDAEKQRVVYEPVSIEPRVGVPRVIRDDSRWQQAQSEGPLPKSTPPFPADGSAGQ
jgi:NADH-quinone oxidoreductase subunit C